MRKIYSNKILRVAKSWIGTKFCYYGRVKINEQNKGGVDCIGLIMKVGEEVNSTFRGKNIISYDKNNYSKFPNFGELKTNLDRYFIPIKKEKAKIGDLIYFNFKNNLEHIGIISDTGIIHCYIEARGVVEHRIDDYWMNKAIAFYRYPKN